jgi:hypothetical protein
MKNTAIVITAICALVVLEGLALWQGIDGTVFSVVVALVAGMGGYEIAKK